MALFTWVCSSFSSTLALGRVLGFGKLALSVQGFFAPAILLLLVVSLGWEGYLLQYLKSSIFSTIFLGLEGYCSYILKVVFLIQYFSWLGRILLHHF